MSNQNIALNNEKMNPYYTVSYYENLYSKNSIETDLSVILDGIKNGKYKKQIETLRNEERGKQIKTIKASLPCFTVSGIFPSGARKSSAIIRHTGLVQIDFDHVKELRPAVEQLKKDKYTYCSFISPSGNGIKLIVKIPDQTELHQAVFKGLQGYYKRNFDLEVDQSTKDVSRLFFVSYDNNLFINENSAEFKIEDSFILQPVKNILPGDNDKYAEVEKLISQLEARQIDITNSNGYHGWLNLGFAFSTEFGQNGASFFHRISSLASNYNKEDCEKQYQACLNNGNSGVTIKTFFHAVKEFGIDISDQMKVADEKMEQKNPYPKSDLDKNGFYQKDGRYYMQNKNGVLTLTNYTQNVKYFFPDGSLNAGRIIELENKQNGKVLIEMTAKDLSAVQSYKSAIRSKGNFAFRGTGNQLDTLIEVSCQEEITAHKLSSLGFEPESGAYAFSNGVLDENQKFLTTNDFGVVKLSKKNLYIPSNSILAETDDRYKTEKSFFYKKGSLSFEDWSKDFVSSFGINGVIGTAFLVSALYRDIVFKHYGHYPFLFLFGSAGGGKTTYATQLLSPFVNSPDLWSTTFSSTDKAIARKVTLAQNSIIYIKEFDTNNVKGNKVQFLKNAYDGVGYERAQTSNDNRTHQTAVKSAIMLDGNFLPTQESALYDRFVVLYFDKSNFTETSTNALNNLDKELRKGAGQIIAELLKHRQQVMKNFPSSFNMVSNELKEMDTKGLLSSRTKSNLACMGSIILSSNFLQDPGYKVKLVSGLFQNAVEQQKTLREIDEVNVFWQSVAYYCDEFKNGDTTAIGLYNNADYIGVKLSSYFPRYIEFIKLNNIETALDISALKKHICRSSYNGLLKKDFSTSISGVSQRFHKYSRSLIDNYL